MVSVQRHWSGHPSHLYVYVCRCVSLAGVPDVAVCEHRWGDDVSALGPPFDVIVACGGSHAMTSACQ